jgi:hypothetical protein
MNATEIYLLVRYGSDGSAKNLIAFESRAEAEATQKTLADSHASLPGACRFVIEPLKFYPSL